MVTKQELLDLAILSKLEIPDDEVDGLLKDMEQIIAFADTINAAVESGEEFDNAGDLKNVFREDEVAESYPQEKILQNAKTTSGGYFHLTARG